MSWGDLARRPTQAGPCRPEPPVITQRVLEEFVRLRAERKRLGELREHLLELLEAGAPVEPGRLGVHLKALVQRRLSASTLTLALGEQEVEALKSMVEPTEYRQVIVTDAEGGNSSGPRPEESSAGAGHLPANGRRRRPGPSDIVPARVPP